MAQGTGDNAMLTAYAELVRRIWQDDSFREKALSDPRAALGARLF